MRAKRFTAREILKQEKLVLAIGAGGCPSGDLVEQQTRLKNMMLSPAGLGISACRAMRDARAEALKKKAWAAKKLEWLRNNRDSDFHPDMLPC